MESSLTVGLLIVGQDGWITAKLDPLAPAGPPRRWRWARRRRRRCWAGWATRCWSAPRCARCTTSASCTSRCDPVPAWPGGGAGAVQGLCKGCARAVQGRTGTAALYQGVVQPAGMPHLQVCFAIQGLERAYSGMRFRAWGGLSQGCIRAHGGPHQSAVRPRRPSPPGRGTVPSTSAWQGPGQGSTGLKWRPNRGPARAHS